MELTFLGATGTVTGSKYLVRAAGATVLVDCGLFQGYKQLRLRNWSRLPANASEIDAIVLTHAHIDHSGYVPLIAKQGFRGPIRCTSATRDLCAILLPDSGHLQEEDARLANRYGHSKHRPAEPLYTHEDAVASLRLFDPAPRHEWCEIVPGLSFRLSGAGHILGAAHVELRAEAEGRTTIVVFSGDVGRQNDALMYPPEPPEHADYLVVESTYGNRHHDDRDPADAIADAISTIAARGGVLVVPAFAVGRAQAILWYVRQLKKDGRIPDVPVFLDSPMAIQATRLFGEHVGDHRLSAEECTALASVASCVSTPEESKRVSARSGPMIVVSASGMATGGRVLHHLKAFAPDARNMVMFAGYQAGGTRGSDLVHGADVVKIHGEYVPVAAEVRQIDNLSAHADANELIAWMKGIGSRPKRTFVTHGEAEGAEGLRRRVRDRLGWECVVPEYRDRVEL